MEEASLFLGESLPASQLLVSKSQCYVAFGRLAKYHSGLLISHTVPSDLSSRALYSIYLGVHTVSSYKSSRDLPGDIHPPLPY